MLPTPPPAPQQCATNQGQPPDPQQGAGPTHGQIIPVPTPQQIAQALLTDETSIAEAG